MKNFGKFAGFGTFPTWYYLSSYFYVWECSRTLSVYYLLSLKACFILFLKNAHSCASSFSCLPWKILNLTLISLWSLVSIADECLARDFEIWKVLMFVGIINLIGLAGHPSPLGNAFLFQKCKIKRPGNIVLQTSWFSNSDKPVASLLKCKLLDHWSFFSVSPR